MRKEGCKTCETIVWLREQAAKHQSEKKIRNTLRITLTQETRVDGIFSGRMNISCGRMIFCPECGRKLKKSETMYDCRRAADGK